MKKVFAIIVITVAFLLGATTSHAIAQGDVTPTEIMEAAVNGTDEEDGAITATDLTTQETTAGDEVLKDEPTAAERSKMSDLDYLNFKMGKLIGLTLYDHKHFTSLVIRFIINMLVVIVIARLFYYPRSRRRDYMFIFILMSASIFLLVSLMEGDGMNLGAAMGLFAIFGIMRFRTEAVPIREMTYLFMLIAVSVVNALSRAEYHPKSEILREFDKVWDGFGIVTIIFVNLVFIGMAWLYESSRLVSTSCSKYILYDNISLVSPDKREELKADLEKRTGLKIQRMEVGIINFLKDSCMIRIFYDHPLDRGNSIEEMIKMPRK